jgi:hypothetical protein
MPSLWALLKALLLLPLVLLMRLFRGVPGATAPIPPLPDDVTSLEFFGCGSSNGVKRVVTRAELHLLGTSIVRSEPAEAR